MKKIFALLIACLMAVSVFSLGVAAENGESVEVVISIVDSQSLRFVPQKMTVNDCDGDGKITVNDALIVAHDRAFSGGAEAGYGYEKTEYGLSLTKLGGNTSGNFGYYINNKPATNLADEIKTGDIIDACIFEGTYPNIESYAFLVADKTSVREGESVTLTLKKMTFDENFQPVYLPIRGAAIYSLGQNTNMVTDAEGMVTLQASGLGEVVYTATAPAEERAVVSACTVNIEENAALDKITEDAGESDPDLGPSSSNDKTAKSGCFGSLSIGAVGVFAISAIGAFALGRKKRS